MSKFQYDQSTQRITIDLNYLMRRLLEQHMEEYGTIHNLAEALEHILLEALGLPHAYTKGKYARHDFEAIQRDLDALDHTAKHGETEDERVAAFAERKRLLYHFKAVRTAKRASGASQQVLAKYSTSPKAKPS